MNLIIHLNNGKRGKLTLDAGVAFTDKHLLAKQISKTSLVNRVTVEDVTNYENGEVQE